MVRASGGRGGVSCVCSRKRGFASLGVVGRAATRPEKEGLAASSLRQPLQIPGKLPQELSAAGGALVVY